jgi:hypothetical protein
MNVQTQQTELPQRRASDRLHGAFGVRRDFMHAHLAQARIQRAPDAFEIRNVSGKTARGIEIELSGFGEDDAFQAYYLSRCGAPQIRRTAKSIRVCFESLCRMPAQALSHTTLVRGKASTKASQPFVWEFALFGGGSSDRFCLELSTLDVVATYRWLIATNESVETLVADEAPAYVHDARM